MDNIVKEFGRENIVILARYSDQIKKLQKRFGKHAKVVKMSFDGKYLLENSDIFIGSGGTMTAESALLGIPTISYNAVPNIIENYLVNKQLVKRETNSKKICNYIKESFSKDNRKHIKTCKKITSEMEDPIQKLLKIIKQ